jgi:hypothetical protein
MQAHSYPFLSLKKHINTHCQLLQSQEQLHDKE